MHLLHDLPHLNSSFDAIGNDFDPENTAYILVAVHIVLSHSLSLYLINLME